MKKLKLILLVMISILVGNMSVSYAQRTTNYTLTIPLSWGTNGLVESESYQLEVTGLSENTLMPEGSADLTYDLPVTKTMSAASMTITYTKPADYWYKLALSRTSGKLIGEYYLHVTVTNDDSMQLITTASLHTESQTGPKTDVFIFQDEKDQEEKEKKTEKKTAKKTDVQKTVKKTQASQSTFIKTGDSTSSTVYIVLFIFALILLLIWGKTRQKSK